MLPSMFLEQTYVSRNGFEIDDGKFTSQSLCKRTQTDRPLLEEALLFIDEMAQTIKINNPFKLHRSLILNGQDGAWAVLLNTIGFKAFIRLLMEHQIITRIESCYVQVTGDPIKSISNSYESIKNFKFNNRDIFIERQQIFHAFKQSAIGLPCKNQLAKAKSQPSSVAIIKALIESIFYDKRVSIKYPVRKATPSSSTYRKLFSYVKGLVNRNKKCPYRRLFNYHCPITTTPSFHDQDIYSQSDENFNFSPAEKLYETSFLSCVQPVNKVNAYIMAVILRILVPNYNHSNKNNKVPRVIGHLLKSEFFIAQLVWVT